MQIASQSDKLGNKAILLIHFSARYTTEVGWHLTFVSVLSIEMLWLLAIFLFCYSIPFWLLLCGHSILIPFILKMLRFHMAIQVFSPKQLYQHAHLFSILKLYLMKKYISCLCSFCYVLEIWPICFALFVTKLVILLTFSDYFLLARTVSASKT